MLKSLVEAVAKSARLKGYAHKEQRPSISVVIAAYNSPPGIRDLIESLDNQSLASDRFEVIIVNDGSTDDTLARLNEFAKDRPNYRIMSIPNSGWPSKPRNKAVSVARGEFIFFCDHDDFIFPEALERMSDLAQQTNCDVLHPKEVVSGWSAPGWNGWQTGNSLVGEISDSDVQCITPHKLYRTDFLKMNKIKFPENMSRLEDFSFNAQAWSKTSAVATLSDYPCYKWIIYENNSHKASYDFIAYWDSFYNSILPILEMDDDLPSKVIFLRRWYKSRLLERLGPIYSTYSEEYRGKIDRKFQELLPLFPPSIDSGLSYADRLRSTLLRRGEHAALLDLARLDAGVRLKTRTVSARWVNGALHQQVSVSVVNADKSPFEFRNTNGFINRVLPNSVATCLTVSDLEGIALRPSELGIEFAVRSRKESVDWVLPRSLTNVDLPEAGTVGPVLLTSTNVIDPKSAAFGNPLGVGIWDCFARIEGIGLTATQRVAVSKDELHPALLAGQAVIPYATQDGFLALDVGATYRTLVGSAQPTVGELVRALGESTVFLKNVHVVGESSEPAYLELSSGERLEARLQSGRARANLVVNCEPEVDLSGSRAIIDGRRSAKLF